MKFPHRRQFLHLAAGAAALPALPRIARAQAYPSRPARIVVGFAAGGSTDIVARLTGQWLSERLGQQFIIENRPGGGSNIGAEAVVNAAPDGYTLLLITNANATNATLYQKLKFDLTQDIQPVSALMSVPIIIEVSRSIPVTNVSEFIAYTKANPGKVNYGSGGSGSIQHVSGELFQMMTGAKMVHVPYRGAALALTDLMGGQLQVMFDTIPSSLEYIRSGKLRALAVGARTRSPLLPDVPTVESVVPGFEASAWYGIGAPKRTPPGIIEKLYQEIDVGLADPKMKGRFVDLGGTILKGSPTEFGKFIGEEIEKWAKVVKFASIKAD